MTAFQKVLVVDDGERTVDHALSAELAEMGYASVTAPLEATDEVLRLMPTPAAIVLQLPRGGRGRVHALFLEMAERLKAGGLSAKVPVIVIDPSSAMKSGGFAALLQSHVSAGVMAKPEL